MIIIDMDTEMWSRQVQIHIRTEFYLHSGVKQNRRRIFKVQFEVLIMLYFPCNVSERRLW